MKVTRTYKFKLKVVSKAAFHLMRKWTRSNTQAWNSAAALVTQIENERYADVAQQQDEWLKIHPAEAAEWDIKVQEFRKYLDARREAKKTGRNYPAEMKEPEFPVKLKSTVKKATLNELKAKWMSERKKAMFELEGKQYDGTSNLTLSQYGAVGKVDASIKAMISRRSEGYRASPPGVKPEYADNPLVFFKPNYDIRTLPPVEESSKIRHVLTLRGTGGDAISLRFFPTRDYDPATVKSVSVGRARGTNDWWVGLCVRCEPKQIDIPDRVIGVDGNSKEGAHVVVSSVDAEIFRESMPHKLEDLQNKIDLLKSRRDKTLTRNENNRKSNTVRRLNKRIAKLCRKQANIRLNTSHAITKKIVASGTTVVAEDLNLQKMTKSAKGVVGNPGKNVSRKAENNRKMLSVALGQIRDQIAYKSGAQDKSKFILINPAYSSQTCCYCGNRGGLDRPSKTFTCQNEACSHHLEVRDSDTNASMGHARKGAKWNERRAFGIPAEEDEKWGEEVPKPSLKTGMEVLQEFRKIKYEASKMAKADGVADQISDVCDQEKVSEASAESGQAMSEQIS